MGPLVKSLKRQGCSRTQPLINIPVFYFVRTTLKSDWGWEEGWEQGEGAEERKDAINGRG